MSGLREVGVLGVVALGAIACSGSVTTAGTQEPERIYLHKDWQIQSSCEVPGKGAQISAASFDAKSWHRAEIPSTVVGALVTDKTYPDPDYGTNLQQFPGMIHSDQTIFANEEMPEDSPFRCSWWYRTEFTLPARWEKRTEWLHFLGINYRANLWINGQKIADSADVAGTFRSFEFDVSQFLKPGKRNVLAIEIFAPGKDDLAISWADWNPAPADKNTGIWKEVFLTSSGEVTVRNPFVAAKLGADYKSAELTISAEVRNASNTLVKGALRAEVEGLELQQEVELRGGESKAVQFTPEQYSKLKLEHPRLWWPYEMGTPHLYAAKLTFRIGKEISDSAAVTFGIREVTSEFNEAGRLLFRINGRKLLIRGAAWAPDLLLRWSPAKLDADLAYVRDMGLNAIRLEGHLDRDEFFEKTDRMGVLVMPGWMCCDAWERWKDWKDDQYKIAAASLRDQITRLRNHPSVFVWLNGSDNPPPASVEKIYLDIEKELMWPNPVISSASEKKAALSGKTGVKMTGPYEYVPPVYWLADEEAGGAYGYNTETSPGPAIPPRESLEKFIPREHLWPVDEVWNYHAGLERFTNVNIFTEALSRRYGPPTSLDDYERKAQAMAYDGERAMFEAYAREKYASTGVIQWMLNNAWPSLIWHLYDYYLVPAGGYFGAKKACERLHVQYSYDDNSVAVINGAYEPLKNMKVSAKIYSIDAKERASREATLDLPADSSMKAFDLPVPEGLTSTYFLKLELLDASGKHVSDNFYWLSTKRDALDWAGRNDTVYTPQNEFADFTALNRLPQVSLPASAVMKRANGKGIIKVTVKNPSGSVAFLVHLRLADEQTGENIVPVLWSDNYFSLVPGEERIVTAAYDLSPLPGAQSVIVDGYNVRSETIPVHFLAADASE